MTTHKKHKPFNFTKMHGLGNDIVIIDARSQPIVLDADHIRQLSNRHTGIGFDQLMIIEPSRTMSADVFCRIYNSDGSIAEQCGNGLRCVARFIHAQQNTKQLSIETLAGIFPILIQDDHNIAVTMNVSQINYQHLSLTLPKYDAIDLMTLSLGNPHAITQVADVTSYPIASIGSIIATHPEFPHGTNVGFMQLVDPQHIILRTYERGVGLTLACGSNACAAVVAGIINKQLHSPVTVEFELGKLHISWDQNDTMIMQGPATFVYDGEFVIYI